MAKKNENLQPVKVWDLPTRIFHWTLVTLMIMQWLTAENSSTMDYHVWGGYTVLILVLFRLIWGVAVSYTHLDVYKRHAHLQRKIQLGETEGFR